MNHALPDGTDTRAGRGGTRQSLPEQAGGRSGCGAGATSPSPPGEAEGREGRGGRSHKLRVGQTVVQAYRGPDRSVTYQVVRLEPACFRGEPRYLIRCPRKGIRRLVREAEIAPAFP